MLGAACTLAGIASGQTTQQLYGQWSPVYDWSCQLDPNNCAAGSEYIEISAAALIPVGPYAGHVVHWRRSRLAGTCAPSTTTDTWFLNPSNPSELLKNEQDLVSDIFCGGLSWDRNGRLTVAGGFPTTMAGTPTQTYRLDPRLLGVAMYPLSPPPVTCPVPIIKGGPWSIPFDMSIARYYPTVISMDRRTIASNCWSPTVPGGAQIVLGGPPAIANQGNELWQVLDPMVTPTPTTSPWLQTLDAASGGSQGVSPPFETYQVSPANPPGDVRFDSYPRAQPLADLQSGQALGGQIFVAFDVDTAFPHPPPNPPGSSWVVKPPAANAATHGCWEIAGGRNSGPPDTPSGPSERFYAPAVLFHTASARNRVLGLGGSPAFTPGTPAPAHGNVQEYSFTGSSVQNGTWQPKAPILPRVDHNAVVLPIGYIFVVGGEDPIVTPPFASWVMTPELYDPGSGPGLAGQSYPMTGAPLARPRLYHNVAVLLLDGRVLVMGGHQRPGAPDSEHTGEIYSPPYVFNGSRPVIDAAPGRIDFAPPSATFTIDATVFHHHVEKVVLLRPAAVTHHQDYDQRYIELEFTAPSSYSSNSAITITVQRPHESLGPPGYYSLWVVEATTASPTSYTQLIPSQGKFVLLR